MANMQTIQVGKTDNDKTGDPLRVAMQKVNANFAATQAGLDWEAVGAALKREGLEDLVEQILLQAEVMELRANSSRPAEAVVCADASHGLTPLR